MLRNTVVNPYGIELVDYNTIFAHETAVSFIDEMYDLNLIDGSSLNLSDQNVKRGLTHNIITTLCEYIMTRKRGSDRPIFLYSVPELKNSELMNYVDVETFFSFHERLETKLTRIMGVNFIQTKLKYDDFIQLINNKDGECIENLLNVVSKNKPHNLHQLYRFVTDNGLNHIKQKFFKDNTFKKILI